VSSGQPLVEETIINVLRRMGVKEESIKAIQDEKVKVAEQAKVREVEAKLRTKGVKIQNCPPDCSADCSKCANKPQPSETKKIEEKPKE
jgi:hypothetical protein